MQEVSEGLRKLNEVHSGDNLDDELSVSLDGRDLECLSAACFLHSIGLYTGKKGYHKQSYRVIVVYAFNAFAMFQIFIFIMLLKFIVVFYHIKNSP